MTSFNATYTTVTHKAPVSKDEKDRDLKRKFCEDCEPRQVSDLPCINDNENGKYTGTVIEYRQREGDGHMCFDNGDKYFGKWKNDKKHGHGVWMDTDGWKYDGEWKDDKKHGRGVYTFAPECFDNGDKYDGEWRDDKRNGCGVMTYAYGCKYDGEWKDDKRNGRGVMNFAIGKKKIRRRMEGW